MLQDGRVDRLLLVSDAAGSVTAEVRARLERTFSEHLVIDFDPEEDFLACLRPGGVVVVAGGDGTVSFVARRLAGTDHALGIVPLGTFNNFARSLGLPLEMDEAIEVIRRAPPAPVTLGWVNGRYFVEVAAMGLFGAALGLGEAAKELAYGQLAERFAALAGARRFVFHLSRDVRARGEALSLVFANTASTGARLPVASATPAEPYLELSLQAGASAGDLVARLVRATLPGQHQEPAGATIKFRRVRVETAPAVDVYADGERALTTPAEVEARAGALRVLLPPA